MNYLTWGYETPLTIILSVIGVIIVGFAQSKITSSYNKYKKVNNKNKKNGAEVAREILDANGLSNIYVVEVQGNLTDHYDPTRKVVRLSTDIFHGETVAAMSVAAHECGHAIQDKVGYPLMRIRSALVPFVNLVSYLGYFGLIVSLFAGITGYLMISIITLLATLLFQLVTLPVEFDASKRGKEELKKLKISDTSEDEQVKSMLFAAAMTYVAGVATNILNVLRIILMYRNRD